MKPWIRLARALGEGGRELSLHQRDDELMIRVAGEELMSSHRHVSEDLLAALGCTGLGAAPRVLVGGLGMGFTLRAALDVLPADAVVVAAEISSAIVEWNQTLLAPLAGRPLDDSRVRVHLGDVAAAMRADGGFDAILLDVDNGPEALTRPDNDALYGDAGLARARAALRPGGRLAVWSWSPFPVFQRRLVAAGFDVEVHFALASAVNGGRVHTIYLAQVAAPTMG